MLCLILKMFKEKKKKNRKEKKKEIYSQFSISAFYLVTCLLSYILFSKNNPFSRNSIPHVLFSWEWKLIPSSTLILTAGFPSISPKQKQPIL